MADLPVVHALQTITQVKTPLHATPAGALVVTDAATEATSSVPPNASQSGFGEIIAQPRTVSTHVAFNYPAASGSMNTDLVEVGETNPGAPVANATVSVSSMRQVECYSGVAGAAAGDVTVASVNTRRRIRYVPGLGMCARFTAQFDTPNLATDQLVGLGSDEDALLIGYSGVVGNSTNFRVSRVSFVSGSQVTNPVEQQDFNIDTLDGNGPSGIVLNPQTMNVYQISLQWLGGGNITLYVENNASGKFTPFHQFKYSNLNTEPSLANASGLSLFCYAIHGDLSGSPLPGVTLRSSSMSAMIDGPEPLYGPRRGAEQERLAITATPVLGLRCSTTMPVGGAYTNRNSILVNSATAVKSTGNRAGIFRFLLNPTTVTGPAWTAYDANKSFAETDNTASAVSGGTVIGIIATAATGSSEEKFDDLRLPPGSVLYVTFTTSGSASDIDFVINWTDLF